MLSKLFIVTMLDLVYTNSIYIILSIITGIAVDQFYGNFDENKYINSHISIVIFDITSHIILLSIILYACRYIVLHIYSPMSNIKEYDRSKLYQLHNATIFTAMIFIFQNNLMKKISYLHSRLTHV